MPRWPLVLPARIEAGELRVNLDRLAGLTRGVKDCNVRLVLEAVKSQRSQKANAYYWSVVIEMISQYTGYHPDETHEAMKMLHLPKELAFCNANGEVMGELVIGGSTRGMTTNEFYDYVERVRQFAAEKLDLNIPDPDPNWREKETEADEEISDRRSGD